MPRELGGSRRGGDRLRFGARAAHGPRLPAIVARHVVAFGALGLCRLPHAPPPLRDPPDTVTPVVAQPTAQPGEHIPLRRYARYTVAELAAE